jgi:hypothetical protein
MEIQDIIQGLTSAEIAAITSPEARTLIVNTTLQQAVIYVDGTFKQASFENTDDITEGTKKFATSADLAQIGTNSSNISSLQLNKEDAFTKNAAFNKDFGASAGDVLEGNTRVITPSEITIISNQSGTNTGDETTSSIQSKRPIKTVGGTTLEGSGDITLPSSGVQSVTGNGVSGTSTDPILSFPDADEVVDSSTVNKFATQAQLNTIDNQSGTNTGDETTTTIQTKRPIKTVNGQTLEGSGDIPISGTVEPLPICVLSSTNSGLTATQLTPAIFPWNVEIEKDTGFTHNNASNNTRIEVDADGTYQINANIRMFSSQQRAQFVGRYLIDGVIQSMPLGSSYIRNNGTSSDFWTCIINPPPVKLTAGQYIEIQIQIEAAGTTTITGQFRGADSTFSMVKLQGVKGEKGTTGSGANIIVQKDDITVGTNTDTLNFEGNVTSNDDGGGKTTLTIGGGQTWYKQKSVNIAGGTVNAAFGSPIECVPFTGLLEITVAESGDYVIYGAITTRANLNSDNGAIELAFGIDTGSGAVIGPQPYRENMNAKKNRRNGIQGTWGNISLSSGDKVHLFLSTLGDSTTWDSGEIFIQTWK